ncbi:MAG: SWIM zinc finger family protein [Microcoleaceae cyanobacterium]
MTEDSIQTNREWWSQQWLDLLDKYRFKKRLERARDYARQGNVLKIEFKDQKVYAQVQGTQAEPYQVSLWLDRFSTDEWNYVMETLSQKAIFSAKLLAGEMPQDIEEVFSTNGLRLFPFALDEVHAHCSCPDKANPCKHIGAIYYMLGDRFSEDPFILFQLRGRTQAEIGDLLRNLRCSSQPHEAHALNPNETVLMPPVSLLQLHQFWHYKEQLESSLVVITPSPSSETVLDRLGTIPLGSIDSTATPDQLELSSQLVMENLQNVYQTVAQQAVLKALS